jgi:hypothetical protein
MFLLVSRDPTRYPTRSSEDPHGDSGRPLFFYEDLGMRGRFVRS